MINLIRSWSESLELLLLKMLSMCNCKKLNLHLVLSYTLYCTVCIYWSAYFLLLFCFSLSVFLLPQLAEVNDNGLLCSAVLSPLSYSTALLSILQRVIAQSNQRLTTEVITPALSETSADLPDIVNSVLGVVYDIMKQDGDSVNGRNRIKAVWYHVHSFI